jgi:ABC-2 type transport system permease protein
MAGLSVSPIFSPEARAQFAAIARLRWQLLFNSLRTIRGRMELVSRIAIGFAFFMFGLGGCVGFGAAAYFLVSHGHSEGLALLLWAACVFWQGFPVMASAFTENVESSNLLRFPLPYSLYFLIRVAYGALDPAAIVGSLWLLGMLFGVTVASPELFPWTAIVLLVFAVFNVLLSQTIYSRIERWLAQRRTREILTLVFFLLMISFQLIGPTINHFSKGPSRPHAPYLAQVLIPVQRVLPPGAAAAAITRMASATLPVALGYFALLCIYLTGVAGLLHLRLSAQYRGENLSETAAVSALPRDRSLRLGWNLPGFATPVAAVFEKEIRYLLRSSGQTLLTFIMPIFALLIFRFGALNSVRHVMGDLPNRAFPVVVAYTFMMLNNLAYNNFGGDGGGIQFFFTSPVSFREIVLGKNITHAGILIAETIVAWVAVRFLYGPPSLQVTIATLAGLAYFAPLNFSIGNVLSLYAPKKLDYSSVGRQRPSQMSALISLGVLILFAGLGAGTFWIARYFWNEWIASLFLLVLAGISLPVYLLVLNRMDGLALKRRETLIAELCRA